MILLIDNYDSFSYNLYQMIGSMEPDIRVIRNDEYLADEVEKMQPEAIVLSPGPGKPEDAGVCTDVVRRLYKEAPILGVCLGHQVICEAFGGVVSYAKELMHGKASMIQVDQNSKMFAGISKETTAGRYHSLIALRKKLPRCLKITAQTNQGEIMAVEHRKYPVYGLQFHPESVLTPDGSRMLQNFLSSALSGRSRNVRT